jgi:hypothetical protein
MQSAVVSAVMSATHNSQSHNTTHPSIHQINQIKSNQIRKKIAKRIPSPKQTNNQKETYR